MAFALLIVPTPDPNVTLLSIDGGILARLGILLGPMRHRRMSTHKVDA